MRCAVFSSFCFGRGRGLLSFICCFFGCFRCCFGRRFAALAAAFGSVTSPLHPADNNFQLADNLRSIAVHRRLCKELCQFPVKKRDCAEYDIKISCQSYEPPTFSRMRANISSRECASIAMFSNSIMAEAPFIVCMIRKTSLI